jgi:hypothetical protein
MKKDTLWNAQRANDTAETLTYWIDEEKKKEPSVSSGLTNADIPYLMEVKKEIKSATLRILNKHKAAKEKELERIQ